MTKKAYVVFCEFENSWSNTTHLYAWSWGRAGTAGEGKSSPWAQVENIGRGYSFYPSCNGKNSTHERNVLVADSILKGEHRTFKPIDELKGMVFPMELFT
jgi:hypothetical protein